MKKAIFFNDFIGTSFETPEEEFESFKNRFEKLYGIKFEWKHIQKYPDEYYDVFFFDYGGLLPGSGGLMESFIRQIIKDSDEHPNRYYVMISSFTKEAMKDGIHEFGFDKNEKPFNIFLEVEDFVKFYKKDNL